MATKETHDIEWLERPLFRKDQQLTPARLNRIHEHQAGRLRHALLGIAGPGVIYGYQIKTDNAGKPQCEHGRLYISCGLAIDCFGRQLYWPGGWVKIDELAEQPDCEGSHVLRVHYAERRTDAGHQCGCAPEEADWIEEGVAFTLRKGSTEPAPVCPTRADDCAAEIKSTAGTAASDSEDSALCLSQTDYICQRLGSASGPVPAEASLTKICEQPGKVCHKGTCDWLYDADTGLTLADISIKAFAASTGKSTAAVTYWGFDDQAPKVCGVRDHVHRNSLLYELINRCHLDHGRVSAITCKPAGGGGASAHASSGDCDIEKWLRDSFRMPVEWEKFCQAIERGIVIHFSTPIDTATLHAASVFMTAVVRDKDTHFQEPWRLPVVAPEKDEPGAPADPAIIAQQEPPKDEEPPKYVTSICLQFDQQWIYNQLKSQLSCFHFGAIIEITVRSAMLRDSCGNMLDGRPLGFAGDTPGQAMPGVDFVAAFCVAPRPLGSSKPDFT